MTANINNTLQSVYRNSILKGFIESIITHKDRPAIYSNDQYYTYHQLFNQSTILSNHLSKHHQDDKNICILGKREVENFSALLGVLLSGKTYVPLNILFPTLRNQKIIDLAKCTTIVVTPTCVPEAIEILTNIDRKLNIILLSDRNALSSLEKQHNIIALNLNGTPENLIFPTIISPYAYLLFTSGSTGTPKGVIVKHQAVLNYLGNIISIYKPNANDRFSNLNELTFDLSIHDLFVCWSVGACLYPSRYHEHLQFLTFAQKFQITFALLVPSFIQMLIELKKLKPNSLPTLKYTFFCGEALSYQQAKHWLAAAENTAQINIYGPTEATIAFTHYHIDNIPNDVHSIVPIGKSFKGNSILIVDDNNLETLSGQGELCVSGIQVIQKYWSANSTDSKFFQTTNKGNETIWYKTGDLVKLDSNGNLHYISRIDRQVKIQGYRVELSEIEKVISTITASSCAVINIPDHFGTQVIAFVSSCDLAEEIILTECAKLLPQYMMPSRIIFLEILPHNVNRKINYQALIKMIDEVGQ